MPNIQIKNVPEESHRTLKARAGAAGQSLQEYMLGEIERMTSKKTWNEIFAQLEEVGGGTRNRSGEAAEIIHAIRAEREQELQRVIDESRAGVEKRGR